MRAFREAMEDCLLQDLGWSGAEYTWDNGQAGSLNVKARLDRALGNAEFLNMFDNSRVRHIYTPESDHCFIMVDLRDRFTAEPRRGGRQFRYEDVWQTHGRHMRTMTS